MEERRKIGERRVNTSRQGVPLFCARHIADRREENTPKPKKHWAEYDIDLITRCLTDKLDDYR
jgi:hypothetical protein